MPRYKCLRATDATTLDLEDQRGSRLSMNLAIEQRHDLTEKEDPSPAQLSPALSRSLDVLVNLSYGG